VWTVILECHVIYNFSNQCVSLCSFRKVNSIEAPLILNDEKAECEITNMVCHLGNKPFRFSVVQSGWFNFNL
jgi:hypothetical protein